MSRPTRRCLPGRLPGRSCRLAVLCVLLWLAALPVAHGATTSYATYEAYSRSAGAAGFVGADPAAPGLLSDAQFAGQLDDGAALLGMFYGNQGWQMQELRDMESWQAKKFAVVHLYSNWCPTPSAMDQLFGQQLIHIWNNHNVPLVSWEPFVCSAAQTPVHVEALAAQGHYDEYLTRWLQRLRHFVSGEDDVYGTQDDRRVFLRLAHEMNGDWLPWSAAVGGDRPGDYVQMWRNVRAIADRQGLDARHVQWVWSVNHTDNGAFRAEHYYPGDRYVDWIALSGYNWGETQSWSNWSTPEQVFGPMLARMRALASKPLAISEVASSSLTNSGVDIRAKSQWIAAAHEYALAQDIRLVAWFNQDKETDWAVFGGVRGDGSYTGDGAELAAPGNRSRQAFHIVAAALLAVFILAEISFVVRRSRGEQQ